MTDTVHMDIKSKGTGSHMKIVKYIVIGFVVICIISAIAGGSKSPSTQPTSAAPAVHYLASKEGGPGVTAEEAYNMDASCEMVHADEYAKCEHLYAPKKLEEESAEATAVLKHRQAEQTASNLEAIAQAQTEAEAEAP
jgi:hypothetical protein